MRNFNKYLYIQGIYHSNISKSIRETLRRRKYWHIYWMGYYAKLKRILKSSFNLGGGFVINLHGTNSDVPKEMKSRPPSLLFLQP